MQFSHRKFIIFRQLQLTFANYAVNVAAKFDTIYRKLNNSVKVNKRGLLKKYKETDKLQITKYAIKAKR